MKRIADVRGFTLIEIAVVLGMVAVLATLLFAVIARVRQNGHKSVCQSNLRQLSLAYLQYMQDNDNRYPNDEEYRD